MEDKTPQEAAAEAQVEADKQRAEANAALARIEGEEAMRIAKINHPNTDWQADPVTGAPLIPGSAQNAEDVVPSEPPEVNADGTIKTEEQKALEKDEAAAAKEASKPAAKEPVATK